MGLKFTKLEKPITLEGITFDDVYVYDNILLHMADATLKSIVFSDANICGDFRGCAQLFALREVAQNFVDSKIKDNLKTFLDRQHIKIPFPTNHDNGVPSYLHDVARIFATSYKDVNFETVRDYYHFSSSGTLNEDIFVWGYTEKDMDNYYPFRFVGHFGVGLKETILVLLYALFHRPMSMVMSFGGHVYTLAYNYDDKIVLCFPPESCTSLGETPPPMAPLVTPPPYVRKSNPVILRGKLPVKFNDVTLADGQIHFFIRKVTDISASIFYLGEKNVFKSSDSESYLYHDGLLAGKFDANFSLNTTSVTTDQYRTRAFITNSSKYPLSSYEQERNMDALLFTITPDDVRDMVKFAIEDLDIRTKDNNNEFLMTIPIPQVLTRISTYIDRKHYNVSFDQFLDAFVDALSPIIDRLAKQEYVLDYLSDYEKYESSIHASAICIAPFHKSYDISIEFSGYALNRIRDRLNARFGSKGYKFVSVHQYMDDHSENDLLKDAVPVFSEGTPIGLQAGVKLGEFLVSLALYLRHVASRYHVSFRGDENYDHFSIFNQLFYQYIDPIPNDKVYIFKDDFITDSVDTLASTYTFTGSGKVNRYIIYAPFKQLKDFLYNSKSVGQLIFLTSSVFVHEASHYFGYSHHGDIGFEYIFSLLNQSLGFIRLLSRHAIYLAHNVINLAYADPEMFMKAYDFRGISHFFIQRDLMEKKTCNAVIIGDTLRCVSDVVKRVTGLTDLQGSPVTLTVEDTKVKVLGIDKVERLPLYD